MMKIFRMLLMLLLAGCTALAEAAPVSPEIALKGNPTTGYSWTWTAEKPIVTAEGGYVPADAADGLVGAGGEFRFALHGAAPGEGAITFAYARPWETGAPLYTLRCLVQVDEALNVTILRVDYDW